MDLRELADDYLIHCVKTHKDVKGLLAHLRKGKPVSPKIAELVADLLEGKIRATVKDWRSGAEQDFYKRTLSQSLEENRWIARGYHPPLSSYYGASWPVPTLQEVYFLLNLPNMQDHIAKGGSAAERAVRFYKSKHPLKHPRNLSVSEKRYNHLMPYFLSLAGALSSGEMPDWSNMRKLAIPHATYMNKLKSCGFHESPQTLRQVGQVAMTLTAAGARLTVSQLDTILHPRKTRPKKR